MHTNIVPIIVYSHNGFNSKPDMVWMTDNVTTTRYSIFQGV